MKNVHVVPTKFSNFLLFFTFHSIITTKHKKSKIIQKPIYIIYLFNKFQISSINNKTIVFFIHVSAE